MGERKIVLAFKSFTFHFFLQLSCLPEGSSCPPTYFNSTHSSPLASVGGLICQACSSECASCTGPQNTNCQSCFGAFTSSSPGNGPITQCLSSCSLASNSNLCGNCHAQCNGCMGPSNQQCVTCRENSTIQDGVTTCVPSCGGDEYLARVSTAGSEYECRACDPQCQGCDGPGNTGCLHCHRVSSTVGGVTTCLESCPEGMFESSAGLCLPECPTGMSYNTASSSCQLSL